MSFWDEFKQFAVQGNVIDLAVGVIIGGAFTKITTSLVEDVLMPPLGMLIGRVDFTELFIALDGGRYPTLAVAQEAGAPTLNWGSFLSTVLDFLLMALVIFVVIRQMGRLRRPEPLSFRTRECPYCLSSVARKASRCPYCTAEIGRVA